jgi:hypothetical protein
MIKQITSEKLISTQDLDKRLAARDAAVKTVPIENVGDGFQQGETISITQSRNYQGKNVETPRG